MPMLGTSRAAALLALTFIGAGASHAAAFANGDFEAGSLAPWTLIYPAAGDGFGHQPADVIDRSSDPADVHGGSHGVGIRNPGWQDASGNVIGVMGMLAQDFDTVAGQTYRLSYWLKILDVTGTDLGVVAWGDADAACNWAAIVPGNAEGSPCGVVPGSWTLDPVGSTWVQYSFEVTATGDRSTLVLAGRSDFSRVSFDDVSLTPVSAVPEPAPLGLLLATGAAALVARRRRG